MMLFVLIGLLLINITSVSSEDWTSVRQVSNTSRYFPDRVEPDITLNPNNFTADGTLLVQPIVYQDNVFALSDQGTLFQLNASDVSIEIRNISLGTVSTAIYYAMSPVINGDYLYVGDTDDDKIYQLNSTNISHEINSYTLGNNVIGQIAFNEDYVYVATYSNELFQLNASDVSQEIARVDLPGTTNGWPVVYEDYLYIGNQFRLHQLNATNISLELANISAPNTVHNRFYAGGVVRNGSYFISMYQQSTADAAIFQLNYTNISHQINNYTFTNQILFGGAATDSFYYQDNVETKKMSQFNISNVSQLAFSNGDGGAVGGGIGAIIGNSIYFNTGNELIHRLNASDVSKTISTYSVTPQITQANVAVADGYAYTFADNVLLQLGQGISECGTLTSSLTLTNDVTSTGTCFTIGANDVTLDCAGHKITYSTTAGSDEYGIYSNGFNNIEIKNCVIIIGQSSSTTSDAIFISNSDGSQIHDNNVSTTYGDGDGIKIYSFDNGNLSSNDINGTSGGIILFNGADNNLIDSNTINVHSTGSNDGIRNNNGGNNNITGNTIAVSSTGSNGIRVFNSLDDNLIIKNNYINATGSSPSAIKFNGGQDNALVETNQIYSVNTGIALGGALTSNLFLNNNITADIQEIDDTNTGLNTLLYNNSFGQVNWTNTNLTFNVTNDLGFGLGKNFDIGSNAVAVNTSALTGELNSSSYISIYGLGLSSVKSIMSLDNYTTDSASIISKGSNCDGGTCEQLSYTGGILLFNTTSLGSFAASDTISCGVISTDVTLSQDISSAGTCMIFDASDVTLDCAGYTITYSTTAGTGVYGIYSDGFNNIRIENCKIIEGSSTGAGNYALNIRNGQNATIYNNPNITTLTSGSYGILANNLDFSNISTNNIEATGGVILTSGTTSTSVSDNNVVTSSGPPMNVQSNSDDNIIRNNNLSGVSTGYILSIQNDNITVDNNVINLTSATGGTVNIQGATNSILKNNIITSDSITLTTGIIRIGNGAENNVFLNNNITGPNTYEFVDTTGSLYKNYLIYNNSYGEVKSIEGFAQNLTTNITNSLGLGLDRNLFIGQDVVSLNFTALDVGLLNQSVNITMYGLSENYVDNIFKATNYSTSQLDILQNGADCIGSTCEKLSYTGNTLVMNTTDFTSFTIREAGCGPIYNDMTLIRDITNTGTCITIGANDVVLDCAGYKITYATTDLSQGDGVTSDGYDNLIVKNCVLEIPQDCSGPCDASANSIYIANSTNSTVYNNSIITTFANGIGIFGENFDDGNFSENTVNGTFRGLYLSSSDNNVVDGNNVDQVDEGSANNAIALFGSKNNNITNNNFNLTGVDSDVILMTSFPVTGNIVKKNVIRSTFGSNAGIQLSFNTDNNIIEENDINVTGIGIDFATNTESGNSLINNNITSDGLNIQDLSESGNTNILIYNNSFGQVNWTSTNLTFNVTNDLGFGLDKNLFIGDNVFALNTSALTGELNSSAQITLYGLTQSAVNSIYKISSFETDNKTVIAGGQDCIGEGTCNVVSYASNTLIFNTSYFSSFSPSENVGCGTLTSSLTLTNDVTSTGTCFTIGANDVVLDCAGYGINYDTSGVSDQFGVSNEGYNNITVKNCDINKTSSGQSSYGVYFINSNSHTIFNNTINIISGIGAKGSYFNDINSSNISGNTIYPNSDSIQLQLSSHNIIENNTLYGIGNRASITISAQISNVNNTIQSNILNGFDSSTNGLSIEGENHTIINNIINVTTAGGIGINIVNSKNTFTIENNKISCDGALNCLRMVDTDTILNLVNNNFTGSADYLIFHKNAVIGSSLIYNNSFGQVNWTSTNLTFNITNDLGFGLDRNLFIGDNVLALNTSALTGNLNSSAQITLYSIATNPVIIHEVSNYSTDSTDIQTNGLQCIGGKCDVISYSGTTYIFNTTGFSSFSTASSESFTPSISFIDKTSNSTTYDQNWIIANVSATDETALDTINITLWNSSLNKINSTNSTSSTLEYNFTSLSDGIYYLNATANDTSGNINFTETRTIILDTTAPTFSNYNTNQSEVKTGEDLNFSVNITDVFNLTNYTFSYDDGSGTFVNETAVTVTENSIIASIIKSITAVYNQMIRWFWFAFDGNNNMATSDIYNITINNTVPIVSSVTLTSSDSLNRTNGTLTGTWSYSDADSQAEVSNQTKWFNNSVEITSLENFTSIASGNLSVNNVWIFSVSSYDGVNWSTYINSSSITIINTVPTQDTPILNATDNPFNSTNANLTANNVSTSDLDGNLIKNIYDWKINGSSVMLLNMPFEGSNTNLKDYTDSENNGTNNGATWNSTGGYDGKGAYEFDGDNDTINIGLNDLLSDTSSVSGDVITISAWVKSDYIGGKAEVIVGKAGYNIGLVKEPSPDRVECALVDSANSRYGAWVSTSKLSTGWTYFTCDYNGSDMNLYINGELNFTRAYETTARVNNNAWKVGNNNDAAAYDFNGTIDEVQIWNRSLSAEQILALYNNQSNLIVSQETSLEDVWKVDITPNDGFGDGTTSTSNTVTIIDIINPEVGTLIPSLNSVYNITNVIEIAATVTDDVAMSQVFANITYPNSTVDELELSLYSGNKYNTSFTIPELVGDYNVSFFANDSVNNINSTEFSNFTVKVGCATITKSTTMDQDVSSTGTCFTIGTNDVTLDCAGYSIDFASSPSATSYGIFNNGNNNSVTKNCNFNLVNAGTTQNIYTLTLVNSITHIIYNNSFSINNTNPGSSERISIYLSSGVNETNISENTVIMNSSSDDIFDAISIMGGHNNITNNTIKMYGTIIGEPPIVAGTTSNFNIFNKNDVYIEIIDDQVVAFIGDNNVIEDNIINITNLTSLGSTTSGAVRVLGVSSVIKNNVIDIQTTDTQSSVFLIDGAANKNEFINNNITGADYEIWDTSTGTNLLIYNNSFGQVNWTSTNLTFNITNDLGFGLGKNFDIGSNAISFNDSALTGELNSSSYISIYGLGLSSVESIMKLDNYETSSATIISTGSNCDGGTCEQLSYTGGTLLFNTTSLGSFAASDTIACGSINTDQTLSADVSSTGTCFVFDANDVTLDCAGHKITYSTSAGTSNYGIYSNGFNNLEIKNCVIIIGQSSSTTSDAIHIDNSAGSQIHDNNISTTYGDGYGIQGVYFSSGNVSGNIINGSNKGISLGKSADNNVINGNTINNHPTASNNGISIGGDYANITNNIVTVYNNDAGIYLISGSDYSIISDNIINATSSANYGLELNLNNQNNNIKDNQIVSVDRGIYINTGGNANQFINNNITADVRELVDITSSVLLNSIIYNNSFGQVKWTSGNLTFNVTNNAGFGVDKNMFIGDNAVALNTSALTGELNSSAQITLYGLSPEPQNVMEASAYLTTATDIFNNGANCLGGKCSVVSYSGTTYIFNTNGFSSFSTNTTECGTVTSDTTLLNDVTSTGTCFTITTDDVEINCQGNSITFNTAGGSGNKGVVSNGYDNITVQHCNIIESVAGSTNYPISITSSVNSIIYNNTLTNLGGSYNTLFSTVTQSNISDNIFNHYSGGVWITAASKNNIINNNHFNKTSAACCLGSLRDDSGSTNNNYTYNNFTSEQPTGTNTHCYRGLSGTNIFSYNYITFSSNNINEQPIFLDGSNNIVEENNIIISDSVSYGIEIDTLRSNNLFLNNNITGGARGINDLSGNSYMNILIYNNSFGQINWTKNNLTFSVNSGGFGIGKNMFIGNNTIALNSSGLTGELNSTAQVTLTSIIDPLSNQVVEVSNYTTDKTDIQTNGVNCLGSKCTLVSFASEIYVFDTTGFSSFSIVNSGSPPLVIWNTPLTNQIYGLTTGNITFNTTITSATDTVETVIYEFDNASGTDFNITATLNSSSDYVNSYNVSSLIDGTHTVTVYANDTVGNVNRTESISFTLDLTAPNVTTFIPTDGSIVLNTTAIEIGINSTDASNVSSVTVALTYPNGTLSTLTLTNGTTHPDKYNTSFDTADLGDYLAVFSSYDIFNNLNNSESINFEVASFGITDVSLSPAPVWDYQDIICNYTAAIGTTDTISAEYFQWYINDVLNNTGYNLTAKNTVGFDNITCQVMISINGNTTNSSEVNSSRMVVNDTASPIFQNFAVSSSTPTVQSRMQIYASILDQETEIKSVTVQIENPNAIIYNYTMSFNSGINSKLQNSTWIKQFTPSIAGMHYLTYFATDGSGNNVASAQKVLNFTGQAITPIIVVEGPSGGGGETVTLREFFTEGTNLTGICGDNICSVGENPFICSMDCKVNLDTLVLCLFDEDMPCNWRQNWFPAFLLIALLIIAAFVVYNNKRKKKKKKDES